jgi:hypothetical membrane protein
MAFMITYSIRTSMTFNTEQKTHWWIYNVGLIGLPFLGITLWGTYTYHKRHWRFYPVGQTALTILGITLWGTYAEATMDSEWLQWLSVATYDEQKTHWHYYDSL